MSIIDGKIIAVTIIGIFYAVTWLLKPQTVIKIIINTLLGIITIFWTLDFFGIYPVTKILPANFFN
jgi:hypothetical protein